MYALQRNMLSSKQITHRTNNHRGKKKKNFTMHLDWKKFFKEYWACQEHHKKGIFILVGE